MSIACYPRVDVVEDREGVYFEIRYTPPVDSDRRTAFLISNKRDDMKKLEECEEPIDEGVVLAVQKNGFFDWSRNQIVDYIGGFRSGFEVFDYLKSSDFFDLSKSQVVKKSGSLVRMLAGFFRRD